MMGDVFWDSETQFRSHVDPELLGLGWQEPLAGHQRQSLILWLTAVPDVCY